MPGGATRHSAHCRRRAAEPRRIEHGTACYSPTRWRTAPASRVHEHKARERAACDLARDLARSLSPASLDEDVLCCVPCPLLRLLSRTNPLNTSSDELETARTLQDTEYGSRAFYSFNPGRKRFRGRPLGAPDVLASSFRKTVLRIAQSRPTRVKDTYGYL